MSSAAHSSVGARRDPRRLDPDPVGAERGPRRWRSTRLAELVHATDPGLDRLRLGLQMMTGLGVTVAVMYGFMQLTHILWAHPVPGRPVLPAEALALAAQHHGETLLAMLTGGVLATVTMISASTASPREEALTVTFMPIPLIASMALAIELVPHHAWGVAGLAVMLGLSVYARRLVPRIGPRAVTYGLELFVGYLFGFLADGSIRERQLGWFAIFTCLALLVNLVLKLAIFGPLQRRRLRWSLRSFTAQSDGLIAAAARVLANGAGGRPSARLHGRIRRLNATALVIDASLDAAGTSVPTGSPAAMHRAVFRTERAIHTLALGVEELADGQLSAPARAELGRWLAELRSGRCDTPARALESVANGLPLPSLDGLSDLTGARVRHLAGSILELTQIREAWPQLAGAALEAETAPYASEVTLTAGSLPGSTLVSARAAAPGGDRRGILLARLHLDASAQFAIRIALAAGAAAALGSLLSERRYYWAVLAVFVTYMGSNTSGEQVTKAGWRIIGTIVGILVGGLLANLVGHSTWSIAVIIAAIGLGTMLMRANYALFVIGLTIALSQLYGQIGVYSNHLLVMRLEENGIGASIAALAALTIFPVSTRGAVRLAAQDYQTALAKLLDRIAAYLAGEGDATSLSAAIRGLDAAHHQLSSTAQPLTLHPTRQFSTRRSLERFVTTSHHARDVVHHLVAAPPADRRAPSGPDELAALRRRADELAGMLAALQAGEVTVPERAKTDRRDVEDLVR